MARADAIGVGLENAIASGQVRCDSFGIKRACRINPIAYVRIAISQLGGKIFASPSEKEQPPPNIFLEDARQSRHQERSHMARVSPEMANDYFMGSGEP